MTDYSKDFHDSRRSWFVCASSFVVQFIIFGIHSSVGIFFIAFGKEFQRSESATAWVGSLAFGIMFFMGPLATALCDNLGCRVVTCVGGFLSFVGLFTTSYVTNFVLLYFTYGLLWGVGTSFCYFASLVILPMHFRKYLSLAYGIAIAGAGLGVPPMTWLINQLIGYYDWRVTMRILAGITLLMCAASLSYGQIAISQKLYLKLDKKELIKDLHGGIHHKLKLHLLEFISLNPWNNKAFTVWAVSLSFIAFGNFIPFVFLISIANDIGIPSSKSALLIGFQAITQTASRIVFGRLGSSPRIDRVTSVQIIGLVLAINATLFPLARTYSSLVVYVVVFGLFDGCLAVMFGMGTLYIVGEKLVGRAFGNLCFAAAIGNLLGPPVAGFIFDKFGKYDIAFFLCGAIMTFGVCLLFFVPWLMQRKPESCSEESVMILNDREHIKRSTSYGKTPRMIFSYPTEAAFFSSKNHHDSVLQHSVSMAVLRQSDTPPLMMSAMYRAWSAAAQLHCTDSLNGSSGYESDYNRDTTSSQSSEVVDKTMESKFGSVTIITPAMSFDDLEVVVQNERLTKGGWKAGSIDMFSVLFETSLENEVFSPQKSGIENGSHKKESLTVSNTRTATNGVSFLWGEYILTNFDSCRETTI